MLHGVTRWISVGTDGRTFVPLESSSRPIRPIRSGMPWVDPGNGSISFRMPSTSVGAGRSKAKKGQTSGGRIEQRPFSARKPKPSNPGESQETSSAEKGSLNLGEHQRRDAADGQIKGRDDGRAAQEEELNSTWQELGLADRRSGGRFVRESAPVKEATRVGGWGRDKSMQRVITSDEQRATRGGRRERARSGVRLKPQSNDTPVVKKKKKKWEDFDPDPSIRHPPDYYKYGPYGPYAWRGLPVGKIVEGDLATNTVFLYSNVKDDAEAEDRERANVTVDYTEAVNTFDPNVGAKFFYAFARRRQGPRPDPWEDWTLVAQIAIESGSDLGVEGDTFSKLGSRVQDLITQCVAWGRPDLTYVKKPIFHLRLEPQEDFLNEMFDLLDPTQDGNDPNSYYAILCRILNVDLDARPRRVRNAYEALDEQGKMECLEHVYSNHPVQVLSPERYESLFREHKAEVPPGDGSPDLPTEEEMDDESHDPVYQEDDHQASLATEADRSVEVMEGLENSTEQQDRLDTIASKERGLPPRIPGTPRKRLYFQPIVRSAVRPYSYSNVIEEIAEIRKFVS